MNKKRIHDLNSMLVSDLTSSDYIIVDNENEDEAKKIAITELMSRNGGVGQITEDNGEIFNDYENNKSVSEYTSARGRNTIAGCRGYWYSSVDNSGESTVIILTNVHEVDDSDSLITSWDENDICEYSIGDTISIIAQSKYYNCATIKSIEGNIITLNENFTEVLSGKPDFTYDDGFDGNIIYVFAKPHIGIASLGIAAHSEGGSLNDNENTYAQGPFSHVEGRNNQAQGHYSHAEGRGNIAQGVTAHVEGSATQANGTVSHAEGGNTIANGAYAHSEGNKTKADGQGSHAEGYNTHAVSAYSHTEGESTYTDGQGSHAEGVGTYATGKGAHAEGYGTSDTGATGPYSHSEGYNTTASGLYSHSEGHSTISEGSTTHTEGSGTFASGKTAHAEGKSTQATGDYSHAQGYYTIASGDIQDVSGCFNIDDKNKAVIVGNGQKEDEVDEAGNVITQNRKNAYTLDWDGNGWYAGNVEVSGVILRSSTEGSTRKFMLTIDDDGELSITALQE